MGKIKSRIIKNSAKRLIKEDLKFTEKFGENKRILGKTMPSKKIRNQIAGFLARMKKQEKKDQFKIPSKE